MGQNYGQLTDSERNQFYALRKAKIPMTDISKQLSRSRTTLYNELARNTGGCGYRPKQAQQFAKQRRSRTAQPLKMIPEVIVYIEAKLRLQWSPEQIANIMKGDLDGPGIAVSHETIYQHVWDDKQADGTFVHTSAARAEETSQATWQQGFTRQNPQSRGYRPAACCGRNPRATR